MSHFHRLNRIVLVEDDPLDAEMMAAVLGEQFQADVEIIGTKADFEAALRQPPELIVSDSNVKSFDGMAALHIAAERFPDVPFIFCTGARDEAREKEALAKGATTWTTKDDSFAALVDAIKRIMEQRPKKL